MKNAKPSYFFEKIKRTLTTALLFLMVIAIAASALLIPKPATAGLVRKAMIAAGIGAAVHAYAKNNAGGSGQDGGKATQSSSARTSGDICKSQLPNGVAPTFGNNKWNDGLTTLCFSEYTVAYSARTRTPLWSAEHLTRERVNSARDLKRQDNFHEEAKIPAAGRSLLKDYVRSGYDRGHMAPSGGASNAASQNETFSMANIVPQEPTNNRGVWASIEIGTRNYAKSHGALNVITGPLFIGEKIAFINNRVAVPTHLWKLVYDPGKNAGGVYLVENKDTRDIVWKSIPDFEQFSGYRFNLGSPPLMKMPQPKQRN